MIANAVRDKLATIALLQFYKDLPRNVWRQGWSSLNKCLRPPRLNLTPVERHMVDDLRASGYAIVEGYWPRDRALATGQELESRVDVPQNRELDCGATIRVRFRDREDCGIRRIYDVEKLLPALEAVRLDPLCRNASTALHGVRFKSQSLVYQLDSLNGPTDGDWHIDTFYPEMKAILLLQDVDENCGPTAYIPGSHRFHGFRLRHQFLGYRRDRRVRFFSPRELGAWLDRKVFLCGDAGTLILFDGRGLHRATAQRNSTRSFLMNYLVLE